MLCMSNKGRVALWQTAVADSLSGYVAQMLKLLVLGLALKDALVGEVRDVVHDSKSIYQDCMKAGMTSCSGIQI
jgi:hypothetical protein